ncbi:head-tail connector protein [Carnobacterium maltaromaticum]|uniref:Head-tail connector protein n=1 Tax=Carnobacterium maltaromaticum TaxID=2751 RepID=A0AAW9JVQ2_CARML|nr:head-tail connector protein [Carnobacterium maltaromaticum]MDZ5758704.1 head-tail connector protein [Carnobacterium maltaromaticum]
MTSLVDKLKSHIQFEEGMDDSTLSFYIENAKDYVKKATGGEKEYLIIMIAGIMFDYRVSEKEMGDALDAMTPFFVLEVFADEEDDE